MLFSFIALSIVYIYVSTSEMICLLSVVFLGLGDFFGGGTMYLQFSVLSPASGT